jgi:prepilin-type N-terminal cleavage/methylation domain-containing protein/prepilin-type processing-associated H-X9-DG protein
MSLSRPKGFTLIELLVVIAIIALLAAILFPVFARARENARKSSCTNNVKQLALGVLQYSQDFDEMWPVTNDASGTLTYGWAGKITPYVKSTQIFQCPSDSNRPANPVPNVAGYTDYAINSELDPLNNSVSTINRPGVVIMIVEGSASRGAYRTLGGAWVDDGTSSANSCPTTAPYYANLNNFGQRHLNGLNLGFVDGHVKWYPAESPSRSTRIHAARWNNGGTCNANVGFSISGSNPTFNGDAS